MIRFHTYMKTILVLLLTLPASAATIVSIDVSSSAQNGQSCRVVSSGPSAGCFSEGTGFYPSSRGSVYVGVQGETISGSASSVGPASGSGYGTLNRDDIYSIGNASQVFGIFHLICAVYENGAPTGFGLSYSINGSALTSCLFNAKGGEGENKQIRVPLAVNGQFVHVDSIASLSIYSLGRSPLFGFGHRRIPRL